MKILRTRKALKAWREKQGAKTVVGFVPTMGALHEGHLSLVRKSKRQCKRTIVSIFVNPTQFGPNEDYKKYPRSEDEDLKKLKKASVDAIFIPKTPEELYPSEFSFVVEPDPKLVSRMEGLARPGHFRGVATVVLKLFQLVQPQRAYFGKKDFQQLRVIEEMCRSLHLNVAIVRGKTVRHSDGLAMSSRNRYLKKEDRKRAAFLYQTLRSAQSREEAKGQLVSAGFEVEYLEVWEKNLAHEVEGPNGRWLVAARFSGVRFIDNHLRGG